MPRQAPPYWSKYAFVDINRDAHQLVHETTKALSRMFFEYHPVIVHDLHESVPLLMTWNGTGPYNPNIDPITFSEFLALSFHEVETMTGIGMPGVSTWNFGEGFGHMFTDSVAMNHNAIGRGYETFGNGTAETLTQPLTADDTSPQWYRVLPPVYLLKDTGQEGIFEARYRLSRFSVEIAEHPFVSDGVSDRRSRGSAAMG